MKLADIVCPDAIVTELSSNDRDEVIKQLAEALNAAGKFKDGKCEEVITAVIDRENEASTGIGKGVAVPHVKCDGVDDVVAAVGLSSEGIDFSSLDKKPVYSVILLVSAKGNPDKHLQAMEVIFKNLQKDDFRSFLRQAETVENVVELLKEADEEVF